jgi:hypothetical protein
MEVAGANRRWRCPFRYRGSRRESAVAQLFSLGDYMKRCYILGVVVSLVVCGCESQHSEQIPVTILPPPSAETAQQQDRQHLQGGSLYADRQAALKMNDRLNEVPECRSYILAVLSDLNQSAYTNCSVGTTFYLRLEIYQNGSIGNVAVDGWTNAVSTPLFIQCIKQSHFSKWPDSMRSIVGRDYFVMWVHTGTPSPPGPS